MGERSDVIRGRGQGQTSVRELVGFDASVGILPDWTQTAC